MIPLVDSSLWTEISTHYNLDAYGQVMVGRRTRQFGFSLRIKELQWQPSVIFGLAQADAMKGDARFAVRIDLASGEIWDAAHDTGLVGTLNNADYPGREDLNRLSLRWSVEHAGDALIPRLHLGDEEFLYPAVRFAGEAPFLAFTGHDALELEGSDIFRASHVWCVDRLADEAQR